MFRCVLSSCLLLLGMTVLSHAQPLPSPPEDAVPYWIFLTERPAPPSPASLRAADPHAETRRRLRGTAPDASPLVRPVAPAYVEALRQQGIEVRVQSRWLHAVSASLTPPQRVAIAALPFVRDLQPVAQGTNAAPHDASGPQAIRSPVFVSTPVLPPSVADSSTYGASYPQLRMANALAPLERGIHGEGVRLGFLDTRFRKFHHPVFDALRADGRLLKVRDFAGGTQTNNHGGAVASVAVGYAPGTLIGPAHQAEVLAATTEYTPSERNVEEDYFVAGLEWMEAQGADVVNVSLGYTRFDEGERSYTTDDLDGDTAITTMAVDAAAQLGMTVVVSAGNSGCADPASCWFYIGTPADADSAIAVGGVEPDGSLVGFSSRGPTADGRTKPDVVALGRRVVVAWDTDRFVEAGGTSFASPLVAGVVAQMLQVNPALRPMQIRTLLRQTADQSTSPDNKRGWGILNADAAVHAATHDARRMPPAELTVRPPRPSPARSSTTFTLQAPDGLSQVDLSLYDLLGRRVHHRTVRVLPGPNRISLSVASLPPGLYLYRLKGTDHIATGKLVVLR